MKTNRQVKERPILFNAAMVKAILEGRKTMTRRVMKPQPSGLPDGAYCDPYNGNFNHFTFWTFEHKMLLGFGGSIPNTAHWRPTLGIPGDRLWVRETWAHVPLKESDGGQGGKTGAIYKADGEHAFDEMPEEWDFLGKWRPSIHMPRWASRITLEITGVRVERVQEISEEDARAEGVYWHPREVEVIPAKPLFQNLWDSLYGSWQENPWCWVIEFNKL